MGYRFGIPSYKRLNGLYTLKTLVSLGYKKDQIVISTQCEKDYQEYKEAFGEQADVIYKKGFNDSQNRNAVLDYFGSEEKIILLDDDIRSFCKLTEIEGKKMLSRIETREALDRLFDKMFAYCEKHNSPMWAWYPVPDPFFMSDTVDAKNILCGTVYGIKNYDFVRFDEAFDLKGDYEISLRLIQMGYNEIRFNGYTVEAGHNTKGGCADARKAGRNADRCAELLERYPTLIAPGNRKNEIKYIGKRRAGRKR